jgi:TP53 regulating kinase-like protein
MELFHRGAEANLFISQLASWKVVVKKRVPKHYRDQNLDLMIRRQRTMTESSLMHESRISGVRTPTLFGIDLDNTTIVMMFIPGSLARDSLDSMKSQQKIAVFTSLGEQVGLMHQGGIVHGDLTTSNLIISEDVPYILDFGMAHRSVQTEDRAVDLHLMQRSITTSHKTNATICTSSLHKGYRRAMGETIGQSVIRKAAEIARRGRYFAIR